MMSGLGRHRDATHAMQYATTGLFTSVKPFQKLRTERCTVPVIKVISTSFYELNKKIYFFFWLHRSIGIEYQPKKYWRYRSRYTHTKVSVSQPAIYS